ncbi:MAG: helix-turn-helix domain-containing protein [Clostridia bacterium]|nr:helix-turn-helix domain-containing protein [Clostridia bacterium]
MANDYSKLIELLSKCKGNRSLNKFAEECGVDAGHLSRIMRGIMVNPPNPDTLRKIAENAHNGITFEELMLAAGYLEKKFVGSSLALLRGKRTYDELSKFIKGKVGISLSPWLLERYEKELEQPDEAIIEYLATAENMEAEFFYQVNNESTMEIMKVKEAPADTKYSFMSKEVEDWVMNSENYPYIEFIYNAYKAGIPKELLNKAEISIKIK